MLRLAAGLSQSDVAGSLTGQTDASNKLVSQIENGRQRPTDEQLSSLAHALGCTPEFLLRPRYEAVSTRPWLRAYADANARTVDSVLAEDVLVHEAVALLKLRRIPDQLPLFEGDLNDDDAIEEFAQEVRTAADVGADSVLGNAMRAADRLGIIVLPLTSELGKHLGMSHRVNGVPFVRVSRPGNGQGGVPGDRQRFTVVHEIGHLCLHSHLAPPETAADAQRIERQAHRFASALLTPADPLLEDFYQLGGRATLTTLQQLKATWGVAIKALVVRFQQLGIIGSDQATSLYKQISKRGWNKAEPVAVTPEQPIWLERALEQRATVDQAASVVGLDGRIVAGWIDWSAIEPSSEVARLRSRDELESAERHGDELGLIIPLTRRAR